LGSGTVGPAPQWPDRSVWYYHTGSLLDLLIVSRLFAATDPRDKVYSVLSLARVPVEEGPPGKGDPAEVAVPPRMRIDYTASVSQVYQRTAKYLINRDRTLDILCIHSAHRDPDGSSDLPSWTPDWRVPVSKVPLMTDSEYFTHKWGAAGFSRCLPQDLDEDDGKLVVEGFAVAHVTELYPLAALSLPTGPKEPSGDAELFEDGVHLRRYAMAGETGAEVVPSNAQVGDTIAVLFGCKMPIILRPVKRRDGELTATVVGPCWLPKIMFGKAMKEFLDGENGGARRTKIELI